MCQNIGHDKKDLAPERLEKCTGLALPPLEDKMKCRTGWWQRVKNLVGDLPTGKDQEEVCMAMPLHLSVRRLHRVMLAQELDHLGW
jgi:hypothetical protein